METDQPKISIVTPSFNQGAYIEKTIDSVLSQNYPNLEYIIIDGGSKDQTVDVIKKYEKYLTYWISEPDRGQSHAINKGLGRASGDLLTWLNSDDWLLPGALSSFASEFNARPESGLIVGVGEMVDLAGQVTEVFSPGNMIDRTTLLQWFRGSWFLQPACMFRRSVWEMCGPLDENEHLVFDIDFFLRASEAGFIFHTISATLARALRHDQAKTTAFPWQTYVEGAFVIERHGGDGEIRRQADLLIRQIEKMAKQLAWYERNYANVISHPLVRLVRPLAKRLARDESRYWRDQVPEWVRAK